MIYISHRGNINGKNIDKENMPEYILETLKLGFDVEIDVWYDKYFFLGHDKPLYRIDKTFLINNHLWCHAKNLEALYELSKINTRYFWHQNDNFTLTSDNIIWSYPGQELTDRSICVLPENTTVDVNNIKNCYGICSDHIIDWRLS